MSHSLYNGDMKVLYNNLEDESIDFVFADLPYAEGDKQPFNTDFNNAFRKKNYKMIHEEWDKSTDKDIFDLHVTVVEESWKKLKEGGVLTLTCSTNNKHWFYSILGVVGKKYSESKTGYNHCFRFLNEICWYKPNAAPFFNAKFLGRCVPSCEYVLIYSKGLPKSFNYDFLRNDRTIYEKLLCKKEDAQLRDLWLINTTQGNWVVPNEKRHPAQKPKILLNRLIQGYTNPGDVILDPCYGSAGILKLCHELNRNFIGFELNEQYYNQSVKLARSLGIDNI